MVRKEIINKITSILEELRYPDAVAYLTQIDRKWLEETIKVLEKESCDDAISRAEAIWIASGYCHFANIPKELEKLPSVQPERKTGHCKGCKWWKDSNGFYRRGGRENKCPINRKEVYEGNGYCFMFEPQESEDEE